MIDEALAVDGAALAEINELHDVAGGDNYVGGFYVGVDISGMVEIYQGL